MTERQTRTILYGGAFNPPTKAHAAIVRELVEVARDEDSDLWLLPSGSRYDKDIPVDFGLRISYIHALLASGDTYGVDTRIETYELDSQDITETFTTHQYLSERYPDREFAWVFGSDSVNTMRQWRYGSWLLEHMDMIIVERPGYELIEAPRRHRIVKVGELAVSSTQVRQCLENGTTIDDLVPAPVIGVLRQAGAIG